MLTACRNVDRAGSALHHSKLNFKWAKGGEEVRWHQDIQFWPHTNYSPLTVGTCLHDVGPEQGPLGVIPGSHRGPLFDEYNDKDQWVGCLSDADLGRVDLDRAAYLTPPMAPAIFYLRGISPPEIRLGHMYAGVMPFIGLEIIALTMVMMWPGLGLWLPEQMLQFRD